MKGQVIMEATLDVIPKGDGLEFTTKIQAQFAPSGLQEIKGDLLGIVWLALLNALLDELSAEEVREWHRKAAERINLFESKHEEAKAGIAKLFGREEN